MSRRQLSIVIPTQNRAAILRRCLEALDRQTVPPGTFEVLVADDGSSDATSEVLREARPHFPLRWFSLPKGGANRARNRAATEAQGGLLLFLGDDMFADPRLVAAHLQAHADYPADHVGVVGHVAWCPELTPSLFLQFLGEPDCPFQFCFTGFDPTDVTPGHMYGSHHSVKRSWFEQHGGFDPEFELCAWDDMELEFRYRLSGFQLVYQPEARLVHHHPYDLSGFVRRMHTVGRAALHFYRKHPESTVLTNVGTMLTLRVTHEEIERRVQQLEADEQQVASLSPNDPEFREGYERLRRQWWDVLWHSMALGGQEEARRFGWHRVTDLRRVHRDGAPEPVRQRVATFLGAVPRDLGLRAVPIPDGPFEPAEVRGGTGLRLLANAAGGRYLYFATDTGFTSRYQESPLVLTVEYLDEGADHWLVEYDSSDMEWELAPGRPGAFKPTEVVHMGHTGEWLRTSFRLADWLFLRRCNGGDFRISAVGGDLCVSRVEIEPELTANDPTETGTCSAGSTPLPAPTDFAACAAPAVSIIIPVHGLVGFTAACLAAIKQTTDGEYEVIVVDNGSEDGTPAYLASCRGVRVLRYGRNLGFAAACNAGARTARGDYLVFLNNDTVPLPGWLAALRARVAQMPQVGIAGSKLLFPNGVIQHAGLSFTSSLNPYHVFECYPPHHPAVNSTRPAPALTGACVLLRRTDFIAVGGFDEQYLNSYEDVDLCLKLAVRGLRPLYCAESVLYHHTSSTPGRFDCDVENHRLFQARWSGRLPDLLSSLQAPLPVQP